MSFLAIISKIKSSHILAIVVVVLAVGFTHFKSKYESEKETSKIRKDNFDNILKLQNEKDSLQVIHLQFQKNAELESYIEQNSTLKSLLNKQGIEAKEYKRLQSLTFNKISYYDSLISTYNANSLIENIKTDTPGIVQFEKIGKCITTKGNVTFENGELNVNLTGESFNGNILITKKLGKRSKKFLFFRYGKRKEELKASTDCGDVKTQIIEKVE